MSVSMKSLVQEDIARTVHRKHVESSPSRSPICSKKAVGAPDGVPLVTSVSEKDGTPVYTLDWTETPKSRAPRKAKEAPAQAQDGAQGISSIPGPVGFVSR